MKKAVKLKFYSHIVTEHADFKEWAGVAQKVVKLLNSNLNESYPDAFFFLHTYVKGEARIYAGSMENESFPNDPAFTEVLNNYDPPSKSGDYDGRRRKGN